MILHSNLSRCFSGVEFSKAPVTTLTQQAAQEIVDQVQADWSKFEAYDQTKLDRDSRSGRLDVYNAPARYQAEVTAGNIYVSESMFPHGDPNGVPVYSVQRQSEQNDNLLVVYEAVQRPVGQWVRRYQISPNQASLQEWFSACPAARDSRKSCP